MTKVVVGAQAKTIGGRRAKHDLPQESGMLGGFCQSWLAPGEMGPSHDIKAAYEKVLPRNQQQKGLQSDWIGMAGASDGRVRFIPSASAPPPPQSPFQKKGFQML